MKDKIIPIFYACDDNFVKYTVVSLHSMIKNAAPERFYKIYILHTGISADMSAELMKLENERVSIYTINVSEYLEKIAHRLPVRDYYTKTTYFRLFIADMFPEYDKALYIDSDTVVTSDISRLYDTDISDYYVGACHEQAMVQIDVYGRYCERVVGISRHEFFNAGILLINTRTFREEQLFDEFLKYLEIYDFVVTQDEDYLNVICKGKVLWLDQRWNTAVTEGFEYPYADSEAYILHYIMVNKPWHYEGCRCADIFWEYAKETSVYDSLKRELSEYTDEQRERDRISGENLARLAISEIEKENNFMAIMNKREAATV